MDYLKYLLANDIACIIHDADKIISEARGRGIAPLYAMYQNGVDYSNYFLTDKVMGMGAAHLCILLHIKKAETNVISKKAYELLKEHHIEVSYNVLTEYILNSRKDDLCPLEKKLLNNNDQMPPLKIIEEFLKSIKQLK